MLFHIRCKDKPSQMNMRASTRAAHIKYLTGFGDQIYFAGPTLTDDGETVSGSMFLFNAQNIEEAEEFAKGDPYRKMGLFESVEIEQIRNVIPGDGGE